VQADITVIPAQPNPVSGRYWKFDKGKLYQMGVEFKNGEKKTYPGVFFGWAEAQKAPTDTKVVIKIANSKANPYRFGAQYAVFGGEHSTLFYHAPRDWFIVQGKPTN
jgi:hypothetical protein